jgi:hypothetical protein
MCNFMCCGADTSCTEAISFQKNIVATNFRVKFSDAAIVYGAQLAIIEGQEKIYLKALALMDND